jgi:hypothetical protein
MSNNNADRLAWTRRYFVRAAGGVVAVGRTRAGVFSRRSRRFPSSTSLPAAFVGSCCAGARPATTRRGESGTYSAVLGAVPHGCWDNFGTVRS